MSMLAQLGGRKVAPDWVCSARNPSLLTYVTSTGVTVMGGFHSRSFMPMIYQVL